MSNPTRAQRDYASQRAASIIKENFPVDDAFSVKKYLEEHFNIDFETVHWDPEQFATNLLSVFPDDYADASSARELHENVRQQQRDEQNAQLTAAKDKIMLADADGMLSVLRELENN